MKNEKDEDFKKVCFFKKLLRFFSEKFSVIIMHDLVNFSFERLILYNWITFIVTIVCSKIDWPNIYFITFFVLELPSWKSSDNLRIEVFRRLLYNFNVVCPFGSFEFRKKNQKTETQQMDFFEQNRFNYKHLNQINQFLHYKLKHNWGFSE